MGWWCLAGAISGQGRDGRRACVRDLHDSLRVSGLFLRCQDTTLAGANQDGGAELTCQGVGDESDGTCLAFLEVSQPRIRGSGQFGAIDESEDTTGPGKGQSFLTDRPDGQDAAP